eukprot:symbB.v1.2.005923.t3/scaffold314.1/size231647/2
MPFEIGQPVLFDHPGNLNSTVLTYIRDVIESGDGVHIVALGDRQGTDPAGNTGSRRGLGPAENTGHGCGEWQGTLARWDRGWGLARTTGLVPAWTQTGKQYRLEEAKRLMIPLTAAQTRDALRNGTLYGVPVDAALRLRFGHWLETRFSAHHLHSTDDIQKRARTDEDWQGHAAWNSEETDWKGNAAWTSAETDAWRDSELPMQRLMHFVHVCGGNEPKQLVPIRQKSCAI